MKINYFVLVNKHGVSKRWSTEVDVKDFQSDALRTITNIIRSRVNSKKDSFTGVFQRFCS